MSIIKTYKVPEGAKPKAEFMLFLLLTYAKNYGNIMTQWLLRRFNSCSIYGEPKHYKEGNL